VTDPRQLALIHAEIDGELNSEQRAELARCLLAEPETRALRDQLQRLSKAMEASGETEPPAELQASILAALPQRAPPRRRPSAAPAWRYAALIAGVCVAGALLFESVRGPGPAATDIAGTMASPGAPTVLDTASVANGPVSGHVSLYRDRSGLGLELDVRASGPVDVRIGGEGHTLEVNGLKSADQTGAAPTKVALPGFHSGETLQLTFLMHGQQVGTATLRVPAGQ
jgi:hypothetical protein